MRGSACIGSPSTFLIKETMHYKLEQFQKDVKRLAQLIINETDGKYECIYGVPQGGVPLAMALSHELEIPITEFSPLNFYVGGSVLIVDDVIDSGATRQKYKGYDFACLHIKSQSPKKIIDDLTAGTFVVNKDIDGWVDYWWEGDEAPAEDGVIRIIQAIGDDPNREGLLETPKRVAKSWEHLFSGYKVDVDKEVESLFKKFGADSYNEMVVLRDIEFYSMCEHHMLPFFGKAHIAYIPNGKVVGISKLARLLEVHSRRLQIQERIGENVTADIMKHLKAQGAACIIEAGHLCMKMRGVEKQNSVMITSSLKGTFLEQDRTRSELMSLIRR
jgi:GTP cyclohydrolase IA